MLFRSVPSRHLVFNVVGLATFFTALAICGLALVVGVSFMSLSGWCVGACPIRPIEILYGQFAVEKNRPEKCTTCTGCISSCHRVAPERSHAELHRSPLTANLAMGFPGFVAAYFLLDLAGWEVLKQGQRCLLPRHIPLLTPLANRWLSQLPLLEQLGLTHWMVARPARQQPLNPSFSEIGRAHV